jgi:hypothetical protein
VATLPHGADQDHDRAEEHFAAEEPHGRGGYSLAAAVALAAETQPVAPLLRQLLWTASRITEIVGAVQATATRACRLPSILGKLFVDLEKKQPEAGIARIRGTWWSTPWLW